MSRIDAHHHFWTYSPAEYGWIDDSMGVLRRDFLPDDLAPVLRGAGVDGVVSVQARQTLAETRWLLTLAAENKFVRGVVGWVPLRNADIAATLDSFAGSALKGVRHVVQDEPDVEFLERRSFNDGLREVTRRNLVYDLLIRADQLPAACAFVDRHPHQRFVLDHAAKPRVEGSPDAAWREQIADLARRPQVWCKLSGLVTEAPERRWDRATLQPYVDVLLTTFGPDRLLFGSDWPVCLVAARYAQWLECVEQTLAPLSTLEKAAIFGATAAEVYQLR